jgi:hypothetical protein
VDDTDIARRPPALLVLGRLGGAGVVGVLPAALGPLAGIAVLFGAWWLALPLMGAVLGGTVIGLSALYRATGGTGSAGRWAAGVTAGATALAGGAALAWQLSGGAFGSALRWQTGIAAAFVVCAGVGTRTTRVPAAALALAVGVAAATQLVPALAPAFESPAPRGCIASSAEEAAERCP